MSPSFRRNMEGYLFISPALAGLIFLTLGPAVACLYLSFTHWDTFTAPSFIGLANFNKLFMDPMFWQSVRVTTTYTILAVPLGLSSALGLALLVNHRIRGIEVYRLLFFMPNIVAGVAMMLVWKWMFHPDFGAINTLLGATGVLHLLDWLGIDHPRWIYSRNMAIPSLVLMSLAGVGGSMMIFLAGLQNIPDTLYEASVLDGANVFQRFAHVTLPLLTPTIFFLTVVGVIAAMQVFTEAFVMTEGGPANATTFYGLYMYRNAFELYRMGYASAMATLLFLTVLVLTLIQWKFASRWVHYS